MKSCTHCGEGFAKRTKEAYWQYEARRFCSRRCRGLAENPRLDDAKFVARYRQVTTPDGRKVLEHPVGDGATHWAPATSRRASAPHQPKPPRQQDREPRTGHIERARVAAHHSPSVQAMRRLRGGIHSAQDQAQASENVREGGVRRRSEAASNAGSLMIPQQAFAALGILWGRVVAGEGVS